MGSFNYFTIHIRSNLCMDTGVSDLGTAFSKANSTCFNDILSKDLSNRPIIETSTIRQFWRSIHQRARN